MMHLWRSWLAPAALLALCLLSFGLFIPALGFYWDDWPSLLIHTLQGPDGFRQFFALDRPTTYISYVALMPIFGVNPTAWQVFTLLLRWACAVLTWQLVRQLWPKSGALALWSAVLFAVYPVFRQQSIALTYHQLWLEYAFFLGSLVGMLLAVRRPRLDWFWTLLAMLAMALNLLISEYFLGVELLRPLLLWLVLPPAQQRRWKRAALRYLPYLGLLLAYLAWRFVFLQLPGEDRNSLSLLTAWVESPFPTTLRLLQTALQDSLHIFITAWYPTLAPEMIDLTGRFALLALGVSAIAAAGTALVLWLQQHDHAQADFAAFFPSAGRQALGIGLLLMLIGPLPGWVTGRQVIVGAWSDRLAVPAMLGASLALAGGIAWLVRRPAQGIILISLLVGLATGAQLRTANDFRWAATQQNRFFWQLYWRAPAIERGTALFARAEVLPKTGLYSTAMGINMIYGSQGESNALPYWFFSLTRDFPQQVDQLNAGIPVAGGLRQWTFAGQSKHSLIVYYEPAEADCLRLLTPTDRGDPALTEIETAVLPIIDLQAVGGNPALPPNQLVFGDEPAHDWCYSFQKAELARQQGDWQTVAALGDDAIARGFTMQNTQSNTPQEWIPFLQGYAHTGRLTQAAIISRQVIERDPHMAPYLCGVWDALREQILAAREDEDIQALWGTLGCGR